MQTPSSKKTSRHEAASHEHTREPYPQLPWSNDFGFPHPLFTLQPEAPSYLDPLNDDGVTLFPFELGEVNDAAINRMIALEADEINSFQPLPSPVTIEAPFSTDCCTAKNGGVAIETSSCVSHFELPAALPVQNYAVAQTPVLCQQQSISGLENAAEMNASVANILSDHPENFSDEFEDLAVLAQASTNEVRKILQTFGCDSIIKISQYWFQYHHFLKKREERVYQLLSDRGVRTKRRKRMGPEISASEKKEIRAQRNRERSQALRRHQKQRLSDLELAGEQLKLYNSATRSLINFVLEHEGGLAMLHNYLRENKCSEGVLSYLAQGN